MADGFVPLAAFVRPALGVPVIPPLPSMTNPAPAADVQAATGLPSPASSTAQADVAAELSLLRLAAIEAFERSVPRLLEVLARDILGRELLLAAADIGALVSCALATFSEHEPVSISVAPCDVQRVCAPLPVRGDAKLGPGDFMIDVRDGAFESHFTLRLEQALERSRQAV